MRIGLFGGSFDPIHWGHLLHAQDAVESVGLDRLVFIPAAQAPLKVSGKPGATADQRLAMLELALADRPEFQILSDEIERGGVSYTVDTVRRLKERWPGDSLFWLLGADQVAQLDQWREIHSLASMVTFLCLRRPGYAADALPGNVSVSLQWVNARQIEISSTEIRARAGAGRPVDFFLPSAVACFIKHHEPYC